MFLAGSGGNFINRVLTLDPSTVPLGGLARGCKLSTAQRLERYRYDHRFTGKKFNELGHNGLSYWVHKELNEYYFPLTYGLEQLIELNLKVVEPIHPQHWEQKIQYFGNDDQLDFYFIDYGGCLEWVVDQIYHKITDRKNKDTITKELLHSIEFSMIPMLEKYHCIPIQLKNILKSESDFLKEYQLACNNMNLCEFQSESLEIYRSWVKTWG